MDGEYIGRPRGGLSTKLHLAVDGRGLPVSADQIAHRKAKGAHGGRPPEVDPAEYKRRNVVERCFNRLKQFRDFATRLAKRAAYIKAESLSPRDCGFSGVSGVTRCV
ncbi:hypothetical protein ACPPVW_10210 [Leifsonia sp. McL0607]|uniref:hypothetical protein n=1 Tax=Leifsonia sp. McL0607 TaxID=3415672 RepID=UPI003CF3F797